MSKRLWTGLLVGLLAAIGVLAVGVGAYHAGERHDDRVATVVPGTAVASPDGTVRVVGVDHWRGGPPFFFFPFFPLLFIGLIVLLIARLRGPCGPDGSGREAMLKNWHERLHAESNPPPANQA
jgi:hypothetical protein